MSRYVRSFPLIVTPIDLYIAVNGIEKGSGVGTSKQLAKEEAARQAYYNMGWAPRKHMGFSQVAT